MKLKKLVLATLTAGALIGGSLQANAQFSMHVDPNANWLGWFNEFDAGNANVGGGGMTFGLGGDILSDFNGDATLELYQNTSRFGVNPLAVSVEGNTYQELPGTIGDTWSFGGDTLFNNLPAGYTAVAFMKVLDAGASWATTQYITAPLVPGSGWDLSLVVADAGAGTESVQAGFAITGPAIAAFDPLTYVEVVPEPTTFALAGLGAAALLIFRRRS